LGAIPLWAAPALLVLSALLLVLGHGGQRVLSGLGLLVLVVLFSLRFVKPLTPGLPIAGVLMIVGGAVAFALGILRAELATAAAAGLFCALLGGSVATHFGQVPWLWGAVVCGAPAFFISLAFYAEVSILLPPIAAAFALTAGLARLLGPRGAWAAGPQLTLPWAFALLVVLAPLFLSLSVARERRRERKRTARKLPLSDSELEKKIARDRARGLLETPPLSDPEPGPESGRF
jgi:hypothetical protein